MITTIYILWLRQLKRYWRSKSRIVGSVGQPLLFMVALGFGLGPIFAKAGGGSYIDFLGPGVIAQAILFMAVFNGVELIWDRQFGFLKETLVAPVPRWAIILGRTLGGATISTIQGVIVLILTLLIGFRPVSVTLLPLALVFMILIALLFTAIGTAIATLMDDFHGFQLIMNFLVMPIFFLSGALFPVTNLPAMMHTIVRLNPLSYGVDGLRYALIGVGGFSPLLDLAVLMVLSVFVLVIGSHLFSKIQM